ncbi:hypothetical protein Taro_001725 [Colocasia esculenta]|uniref:Uncharacterized protein n=1 Tax=Colocasia esculenta TaxID=4460 RepID=A0A843TAS8_COLES|nr:hypothetical protein [Colocasia esculenta]
MLVLHLDRAGPKTEEAETARTPSTPSQYYPGVPARHGAEQQTEPSPQENESYLLPELPEVEVAVVEQYHYAHPVAKAASAEVAEHLQPPDEWVFVDSRSRRACNSLRVAFWRVSGEESFSLARVVLAVDAPVLDFA